MQVEGIKSQIISESDDLIDAITKALKKSKKRLKEKDILCISSKVLSVSQGRIIDCKNEKEFDKLCKKEADIFLKGNKAHLTIKNGFFIPNSGIDKSNAPKGKVILMPKNLWKSAEYIRKTLKKHFKLRNLGIIIIDSTCVPLRQGTVGIALSYAGFSGVESNINKKDIFGKKLKITKKAVADSLSSAANLIMGEANEKIPFVIMKNAPALFTNKKASSREVKMHHKNDIFKPILPKK